MRTKNINNVYEREFPTRIIKTSSFDVAQEIMEDHHKSQCTGYVIDIKYAVNLDENYMHCSCGLRIYFYNDNML